MPGLQSLGSLGRSPRKAEAVAGVATPRRAALVSGQLLSCSRLPRAEQSGPRALCWGLGALPPLVGPLEPWQSSSLSCAAQAWVRGRITCCLMPRRG